MVRTFDAAGELVAYVKEQLQGEPCEKLPKFTFNFKGTSSRLQKPTGTQFFRLLNDQSQIIAYSNSMVSVYQTARRLNGEMQTAKKRLITVLGLPQWAKKKHDNNQDDHMRTTGYRLPIAISCHPSASARTRECNKCQSSGAGSK